MLVWGFTAMIVDRLLAIGGWERPWDAGTRDDLPPEVLQARPAARTRLLNQRPARRYAS